MKKAQIPSLSRRLFISFIISFLIPTVLVSILVSFLFGQKQYKEIRSQAVNNMKLISAYITKYINDIDNITKAPYYLSFFKSKTLAENLSYSEQNKITEELGKQLQLTTYSREDLEDLVVMSDETVLYFNATDWYEYLPNGQPLSRRRWYTEAIESGGRIAIVPSENEVDEEGNLDTGCFYISRKLNNMFAHDQNNVIMVNLKTDAFEALFSELTGSSPLMILFTNDKNELIYSNMPVDQGLTEQLGEARIVFQQNKWNHYSQHLEDYPLTVHILLDASYVTKQIAAFLTAVFFCYGAGVLAAYVLFRRNNRWIHLPVNHIKTTLKNLEEGKLTARCEKLPVREFQEIGASVNAMACELQEKIKNEYELKLAHKSLQLQALQSQIQPHFMINAIYSFIALNQIGERELLNNSFYSFAHLLRYVLKRDRNTTIGGELDFLNDYCALCLLRFGNRLSYEISCPKELKELELPRLLLQPLVENAVIHGIEPSEVPCRLEVSVRKEGDRLYIIIEDTGVGFEEGALDASGSIGIKNVENRIALWKSGAKLMVYREGQATIQVIAADIESEKTELENGGEHEHSDC